MKLPNVCSPTTCTLKQNIDETLEKYDGFIRTLARKNFPRSTTMSEVVDLEIDELAQTTRINLWLAMQKQEIHNTSAFIGKIVYHEAINITRRYKPVASLPTNEESEPYQEHMMIAGGYGTQDPTEEIEQDEMVQSYSSKLTEFVPKLPPQQQRAIICALKDQIADILSLVDLFLQVDIDIESMHWSETASELQSERSSLSVARKKMRAYRKEDKD